MSFSRSRDKRQHHVQTPQPPGATRVSSRPISHGATLAGWLWLLTLAGASWKDGACLESRKKSKTDDKIRTETHRERDCVKVTWFNRQPFKPEILGWFIYPAKQGKWRKSVIVFALQRCRELFQICRGFTSPASRLLLRVLINLRHVVTHDDHASTTGRAAHKDILAGSNVSFYDLTTPVCDW